MGVNIFHFLSENLTSWPAILFSLLTVLTTLTCHGAKFFLADLSEMTAGKIRNIPPFARLIRLCSVLLPHWVSVHLATTLYTLLPASLCCGLVWRLLHLPALPALLAWLPLLPVLPILAGILTQTCRALRNQPRSAVSSPNIRCIFIMVLQRLRALGRPNTSWFQQQQVGRAQEIKLPKLKELNVSTA